MEQVKDTQTSPAAGPASKEGPQHGENRARDAVIYIPGIGRAWSDQGGYDTARRLQAALNRTAVPRARFKTESRQVVVGEDPSPEAGNRLTVYTISRIDGNGERRLLDIYPLNYHKNLTQQFGEAPLPIRLVLLFGGVLQTVLRLWNWFKCKGRHGMTKKEVTQVSSRPGCFRA